MKVEVKYYETADHRTIIVWPDGTHQDATTLPCGVSLDKNSEHNERVRAAESGIMND